MNEWLSIKIKELGRVVTGNTPSRAKPEYYGSHTLFVKPTDIEIDKKYTFITEEDYSKLGYEKYKNSLIPEGSTCVVTIGSIGKKIIKSHCNLFINQAMNAVIPNAKYDNDFVYYLLKFNLPILKTLDSGTASGRENVSKSSFSNIRVNVPILPTQQKIAKILSNYDELIENNLKRIKLLEESAKLTYEEWLLNKKINGERISKNDNKIGLWRSEDTFLLIEENLKKQFPDIKFVKGLELPSFEEFASDKSLSKEEILNKITSTFGEKGCDAVIMGNGG